MIFHTKTHLNLEYPKQIRELSMAEVADLLYILCL